MQGQPGLHGEFEEGLAGATAWRKRKQSKLSISRILANVCGPGVGEVHEDMYACLCLIIIVNNPLNPVKPSVALPLMSPLARPASPLLPFLSKVARFRKALLLCELGPPSSFPGSPAASSWPFRPC